MKKHGPWKWYGAFFAIAWFFFLIVLIELHRWFGWYPYSGISNGWLASVLSVALIPAWLAHQVLGPVRQHYRNQDSAALLDELKKIREDLNRLSRDK